MSKTCFRQDNIMINQLFFEDSAISQKFDSDLKTLFTVEQDSLEQK